DPGADRRPDTSLAERRHHQPSRLLREPVLPKRVDQPVRSGDRPRVEKIQPLILVLIEEAELHLELGTVAGDIHRPGPGKTLVDATVPNVVDLHISVGADERAQITQWTQVPRAHPRLTLLMFDLLTSFATPFPSTRRVEPVRPSTTAAASCSETSPKSSDETTPFTSACIPDGSAFATRSMSGAKFDASGSLNVDWRSPIRRFAIAPTRRPPSWMALPQSSIIARPE